MKKGMVGATAEIWNAERFLDPARLLVVDDEENVALTLAEVLRRNGYSVDAAFSGNTAFEKLAGHEYDLVLTDLKMEDGDGISVLDRVKETAPMTLTVVLTGFASLESAIEALRRGAYDYLIKPCAIDDLKRTIHHGLEHRKVLCAEQRARNELEELNAQLEKRVTERTAELKKANKELEQANRAKDLFLASISHELRAPLSAIVGWTNLLRTGDLGEPEINKALEVIERNARQQAQLISDLLDLSRISSGKIRLEKSRVNLSEIVRDALESIRPSAKAKQIDLSFSTDQIPAVVGDGDRLLQVITNLLSNAVKFTNENGTVSIELQSEGDGVRFAVQDNGIGIDPSFLPFVFDSFRQGEPSSKGGLGLGLAIVQKLVELHKGEVTAHSEGKGKGALFVVRLPLGEAQEMERSSEEGDVSLATEQLEGVRILVVEDQEDTWQLLASMLSEYGVEVSLAESPAAADEILKELTPDLFISDIGLPGEDGYSFIRRLREAGNQFPALALTSFSRDEDRAKALAAGFDRHLSKPVIRGNLIRALISLLAGSTDRKVN